jgi:hypothetical protein
MSTEKLAMTFTQLVDDLKIRIDSIQIVPQNPHWDAASQEKYQMVNYFIKLKRQNCYGGYNEFTCYYSEGIGIVYGKLESKYNKLFPGASEQEKIQHAARYRISNEAGKNEILINLLNCLASDFSGVDSSQYFEDWASECGYDTDSRKAEKLYLFLQKQCREFRKFIGSHNNYESFINCERL